MTSKYFNQTVIQIFLKTQNFFHSRISEEFVAHGASVNCVSLGHKSGRVLVTGGDDKKVNLWAVGKPNCIMVRHLSQINIINTFDIGHENIAKRTS